MKTKENGCSSLIAKTYTSAFVYMKNVEIFFSQENKT